MPYLKGLCGLKVGQRRLFWMLAFVLLLVILWRPWERDRTGSDDESWIKNIGDLKADLTLEGIRYVRNLEGKTQWILWADEGRLYEAKNVMDLKGVKIKFFSTGGQLLITGNSGIYRINKDEMSLKGNVKVESESGTNLYSKSLYFSQKKKLIWTKDNVIIKGNGLTMRGKGLEYDLQSGRLTVKNQTSVLPGSGELTL